MPDSTHADGSRARFARVLGWVAGALAGVVGNYVVWSAALDRGVSYPAIPTTFVAFVAGAFGGMAVADRLGSRAAPVLAGALAVLLVLVVLLASAGR